MASITKVMTALVVIRAGNLNRTITIPSAVIGYVLEWDASNAGLRPGDKLTVRQLLYAMLLPSGADAAYALAEAYGPGLNAFIAKMNATARLLGMTRTHFTNFDGLPYPTPYSNYSTAANLLTSAAPRCGPPCSARSWTSARTGSPRGPVITPTCGTTSTRCSAATRARSASARLHRGRRPVPVVRGHQERLLRHRRHPGQPRLHRHGHHSRPHPHPELGLKRPLGLILLDRAA